MAASLSPESHLWAKQIKREHGFLLNNMQDLATATAKNEERIKAVETAVETNSGGSAEVAALTKQVQAIGSDKIKDRLDGMEKAINGRLDEVEGDQEAQTLKLSGLQRDKQLAEEERKATLTKDKALLKRIGEVEEGLKKYEKNLDLIGKRVNGTRVDQIKEQLEGLTKQVMKEGEQMGLLAESVAKLETANAALMKANQKLEAEMKVNAEKLARQDAQEASSKRSNAAPAAATSSPDLSTSQKKKSHKWVGGGADKDIINQGAGLFKVKPAAKPPAPKEKPAASQRAAPKVIKKPAPKKKPAVPKTPSQHSDRKSHKWAGGGADRDIIEAGLTQSSRRGHDKPRTDHAPASKPPQPKVPETFNGKRVVRAGRGWVEYEESAGSETESEAQSMPVKRAPPPAKLKTPAKMNDDGTQAKRGRGRPRKYPRPNESQTQDGAITKPTSISHPQAEEAQTKKRSADTALRLSSSDAIDRPPKRLKLGSHDYDYAKADDPSIFDTPLSSPPQSIAGAVEEQRASSPPKPKQPSPEPPRRRIVQLNSNLETIIRHMHG